MDATTLTLAQLTGAACRWCGTTTGPLLPAGVLVTADGYVEQLVACHRPCPPRPEPLPADRP
ncbi:hypothetical protein [Streptomyces lonarensis]|uniref:Uncharacterized protein n=1 Tax=Streptomyces lonarensis TaxID=700599 RepID=A0A7X6CXJ7_9ACTN|nr:hypothetical protein [Streptomyces lonarensis]NJQ04310.1 hypothetical protein [Streptomyces lonarensis]